MARVEFFAYNNEAWYSENGAAARKLSETSDIIADLFRVIDEQYPEAMKALREQGRNWIKETLIWKP